MTLPAEFTFEDLPKELLKYVPELTPLYDRQYEHSRYVSAYQFFGAQLVMVIVKLNRIPPQSAQYALAQSILNRVLSFIDIYINHANKNLADVMQTGFIEAVWIAGKDYDAVSTRLTPTMKQALIEFEINELDALGVDTRSALEKVDEERNYAYIEELMEIFRR